jgi:hypothetical protein
MNREFHLGEFVAGAIFALIGAFLLLDAFDVWTADVMLLWPVLLIGIGLALLASWAVDRHEKE